MMTKPISNDRKVRRSRSVGRGAGTADVLVPLAFVCGSIAMFIAGLAGIGWLIVAVGVMASVAVVSRCSPKFRWGPLLMVALVPLLSGVAVAPVAQADAPGNFPGWTRDYVDDFNARRDQMGKIRELDQSQRHVVRVRLGERLHHQWFNGVEDVQRRRD